MAVNLSLADGAIQIGQSATATQNFVFRIPSTPDGTIKLARGNDGATTQDILSVADSTGIITISQGLVVPTSASGNCYSGTYTPTITNGSNVAASTAYLLSYIRVGNHVHVDGAISIDPTSSGTLTAWKITLPVASTLTANTDLGGAGVENSNYAAVSIYAAHATDEAQFAYTSASTAGNDIMFSFGYIIK